MTLLENPVALVASLPPMVLPLFLFTSALLEYVFPPWWGDLVLLMGFFLAGQGAVSILVAFLAALSGSIVGAAIAYDLGRRFGLRLVERFSPRRRSPAGERTRLLFQRFGEKLLLVNRFVPVVRGLMLYGAGGAGIRFDRALTLSAVGSLLWISLLLGVALLTSGTWDDLEGNLRWVSTLAMYVALSGVAVASLVAVWRARRPRGERA